MTGEIATRSAKTLALSAEASAIATYGGSSPGSILRTTAYDGCAYNLDNDTGRASWCSAAGIAGNFQHWRSEPSCGEFLTGTALRCCLRLFVRRQLCRKCTRSEVCAGGEWKKI